MAAKVFKIENYEVKSDNSYFFDTNVWMFIFASIANIHADKQREYSNLMKDIKNRNCLIFTSSLVLSEYINRSLRLSFDQWITRNNKIRSCVDFKRDYRGTSDYKDSLSSIKAEVNQILQLSEKRPDDFNAIDINKILSNMSDRCDFNDSYYIELCERNRLIMVTDDKDFQNISSNITIISA